MSKKTIFISTLIITIGLFLLGIIFKYAADKQKGVEVSVGATIDGKFVATSSGKLGENQEKYELLNNAGTAFYGLAGFTGIICIINLIGNRKSE